MDTGTCRSTDLTLVALIDGDHPDPGAGQLERLLRLADGRDAVVLAVGHGDREVAAAVVRAAAAGHPELRAILHSRRVGRDEALCVAVDQAQSRWILLPGTACMLDAAALDRLLSERTTASPPRREPGAGIVFARDAFLGLPRIRSMHRWLPELLSRADARRSSTGFDPAPSGWLARAWVGLLCRMAVPVPSHSRADP